VLSEGGSLVTVMHTEACDVTAALEVVKRVWTGPLGAYGHSGRFVMPHWQFNDVISPDDYLAHARTWVAAGARLIGGCCGIGPAHIRLLKDQLRQ
jgi:S-methylmethionine-dependent homocysteine/selenocysteine methylase